MAIIIIADIGPAEEAIEHRCIRDTDMILLVMEGEEQNMALSMIHRTLVIAGSRAYGDDELSRLIGPGYNIHLHQGDGLNVYLLPKLSEVRGTLGLDQMGKREQDEQWWIKWYWLFMDGLAAKYKCTLRSRLEIS